MSSVRFHPQTTTSPAVVLRRITPAELPAVLPSLGVLLRDAVAGGASVSFIHSPDQAAAEAFWRGLSAAMVTGHLVLMGAFDDGRLVGTVHLKPCLIENQRHRGDIAKLLVFREHRGQGLGTALMVRIEQEAATLGLSLLTLDTQAGGDGERLYRRLGWTAIGTIPGFAEVAGGQFIGTVFFYKTLG